MQNRGQVLIIVLIFMVIMLILMTGLLGYVGLNLKGGRVGLAREQALQIADGAIDKAVWELNASAGSYTGEIGTVLGTGVFDTTVTSITGSLKEIDITSYVPDKNNPIYTKQVTVQATIDTTTASFNYGVQIGSGGLQMSNNSVVTGNVYSNGPITGGSGSTVTGDAYSAGSSGLISSVVVNGSAYAHTVQTSTVGGNVHGTNLIGGTTTGNAFMYSLSNSCTVNGNAFYTTRVNCTVNGTTTTPYPGDADPSALGFPIPDSQINTWKTSAQNGGTISGGLTLTNGAQMSLGPQKISGNLVLSNNAKLTLTGPVWVTGTINISNNGILALDTSYGNNSEVVVSDGIVDVSNNAVFQRAGASSYIMMITTSNSSDAFDVANNTDALVVYAPYGAVDVSNNAILREITADALRLSNGAQVIYETGLASLTFQAGPGATWRVVRSTWREVN